MAFLFLHEKREMPQKGLEKRVEFEEGKRTVPQKVFSSPQKTTLIKLASSDKSKLHSEPDRGGFRLLKSLPGSLLQ